jgi:hypothetical protein
LYRDLPEHGRREIVALGGAMQRGEAGADARVLLEIVLRVACQAGSLAVTIPRVGGDEIPWADLESMGFARQRTYTRYVARASSGIP